jgi:hypothetical protein
VVGFCPANPCVPAFGACAMGTHNWQALWGTAPMSLPPWMRSMIYLAFNPAGLAVRTYHFTFFVNTGDPSLRVAVVPISFTISSDLAVKYRRRARAIRTLRDTFIRKILGKKRPALFVWSSAYGFCSVDITWLIHLAHQFVRTFSVRPRVKPPILIWPAWRWDYLAVLILEMEIKFNSPLLPAALCHR